MGPSDTAGVDKQWSSPFDAFEQGKVERWFFLSFDEQFALDICKEDVVGSGKEQSDDIAGAIVLQE